MKVLIVGGNHDSAGMFQLAFYTEISETSELVDQSIAVN